MHWGGLFVYTMSLQVSEALTFIIHTIAKPSVLGVLAFSYASAPVEPWPLHLWSLGLCTCGAVLPGEVSSPTGIPQSHLTVFLVFASAVFLLTLSTFCFPERFFWTKLFLGCHHCSPPVSWFCLLFLCFLFSPEILEGK